MNSEALFTLALGLNTPWEVHKVELVALPGERKELHIEIGFQKGAKFADESGIACGVYDTLTRQWKHLNFFEHTCYIHCDVPRIQTTTGQVIQIPVPWARPGSGFTLLFEAFAMYLVEREMPVKRAAETLKVYPQRIWNIFDYWVSVAREKDDPSSITKLGIDETSSKKGHNYVTIGVDMDSKRVIHAVEGKGKEAVASIQERLIDKHVKPEQIIQASMDLSPAFISGVTECFPKAEITFDRFHVVKLLNEAMNKLRILEQKEHALLKGQKYNFLKNPKNLTEKQKLKLDETINLYPTLGNAYRLKVLFNDLWDMPNQKAAHEFMVNWCAEVRLYNIGPFIAFTQTLMAHWYGILNFFASRLTNGLLEGINHKIQLAKRRARGYRNTNNYINMIYFLCGKLEFDYPHRFI
jgi:transposase